MMIMFETPERLAVHYYRLTHANYRGKRMSNDKNETRCQRFLSDGNVACRMLSKTHRSIVNHSSNISPIFTRWMSMPFVSIQFIKCQRDIDRLERWRAQTDKKRRRSLITAMIRKWWMSTVKTAAAAANFSLSLSLDLSTRLADRQMMTWNIHDDVVVSSMISIITGLSFVKESSGQRNDDLDRW